MCADAPQTSFYFHETELSIKAKPINRFASAHETFSVYAAATFSPVFEHPISGEIGQKAAKDYFLPREYNTTYTSRRASETNRIPRIHG